MKTFNWVRVDKPELPDDITGMFCYYTRDTGCRICLMSYVLVDEIEQHKKTVEESRKRVLEGGAWEPIEGATWSFENGRWIIDESQIRKVG